MTGKENSENSERVLGRVFRISLLLKGLDGVLELLGGLLLLFVSPAQIGQLVRLLTQHELAEDSRSLVATALVRFADGLSASATLFAAIYLLLHGVVKVVLVWAVLKDKLWAYPWMIAFLLCFIAYQGYEMLRAFTWGLAALTVFDVLIVVLTVHEYRRHRARTPPSPGRSLPRTR